MSAAPQLLDVREIARMLDARADVLVRELLPDGRRQGHEWVARCPWHAHKNLGSFSVHIGGAKSGVWSEFGANESGDMLDLIAMTLFGGDKKRAIEWGKRFLGLDTGDRDAIERVRRATPTPEQLAAAQAAEAEEARKAAFRIWLAGSPDILGSPVDTYLRGRGIPLAELGHVPGALRFHRELWNKESGRKWPAMVTAIAGPNGHFVAVHRTWLDVQTDGRVTKAPIETQKMTLAPWRGGSIRLWRANKKEFAAIAPGETVDVTEGIEDGLSVAHACRDTRVIAAISLAGFASVVLPPAVTRVCLWGQNDELPENRAAFERAVAAHQAAGRIVLVPPVPPGVKDVNDVLRGAL